MPRSARVHGTWSGIAVLVLCAGLWSLGGPLIKLTADRGVDPVAIAFYRSIIAGVLLIPLARPYAPSLRNTTGRWLIASVLCFTAMTACFVIATAWTAAANAVVLQYTSPIWVFLLSPVLLGERPRRREGGVLLIAMIGVAVIFFGHGSADAPSLTVALASGAAYGMLTVVLRGLRAVHALVVTCVNFLGSGLVLAVAVGLWGRFALNAEQAGLATALSVLQMGLPYVLFAWALQRVEAHKAAIIVLLETVLNPAWTYLAVGEPVPPATLLGGPLILAGVAGWIVVARRGRRAGRLATEPEAASGRG